MMSLLLGALIIVAIAGAIGLGTILMVDYLEGKPSASGFFMWFAVSVLVLILLPAFAPTLMYPEAKVQPASAVQSVIDLHSLSQGDLLEMRDGTLAEVISCKGETLEFVREVGALVEEGVVANLNQEVARVISKTSPAYSKALKQFVLQ